ncbi:MAG: bifunctional 4-hydroxy-2-oxoglutarate aldolase/2-dehydro-3-deoxy-phosphogluconate aldolase [Propionibacterium sp.]|nr:bifunctional 4-hydroxy-2-oxoglutarate aldolase/2-dehydro-3-deoxy-phosphogluconate aldolase [Propionibacterium sp.]
MSAPALSSRLLSARIIAMLPRTIEGSLIAPIEVMAQEGIPVVALPAARIDLLRELVAVFSGRVEFAVHDVDDADQLTAAVDAGATLVMLRRPDTTLIATAFDRQVPVLAPALTPTEVRAVWALGVTGVLVTPVDAFGGNYHERLPEAVPDAVLVPSSGLGAYTSGRWLDAGAAAVCLDEALVGDAAEGGSLNNLRERCQAFARSVGRH